MLLFRSGHRVATTRSHNNIITEMRQVLACLSAITYHLPVGVVLSYSSILIAQLEVPNSEILVTRVQTSLIASLGVMAVPFSALITGYVQDVIGRLNAIRVGCIPNIIGWILIASAQNLPMIYAGRFLSGFCLAMGVSPAIVYVTEVARADLRGSLIGVGPALTSVGMLIIFVLGTFLEWRIVAWVAMFICIPPLILMWFLSPESPAWLLSKGKHEQALKSLCRLRHLNPEKDDITPAKIMLLELEKSYNTPAAIKLRNTPIVVRFVRGISKPTGYKPTLILVGLFFFQQFSGIYITIFYAVTFFQEVGGTIDPYISTILIGVVRMVVGLTTSLLLRKFGRRPLCIVSGIGMAVAISISGYFCWRFQHGDESNSVVPVVCILIYVALGVSGLMTVPWTMSAEMFLIEMRGLGQGLIIALAHLIMIVALIFYREVGPFIGGGPYGMHWFFAGMSLLSCIFVYFFVPETRKKTLTQISHYFMNHSVYILRDRGQSALAELHAHEHDEDEHL